MKEIKDKYIQTLTPLYAIREAEAIFRVVTEHLKGWSLTDMVIHADDKLTAESRAEFETILRRLQRYEPVQYVVGFAPFYGLDIAVEPGVLIPRPETAELVDMVVERNSDRADLRVVDACCGSGCIACALSRNLPFSKVLAFDVSEKAIEVTRRNAAALRCSITVERIDVLKWNPAPDSIDILVSNPPYVDESEKGIMSPNVVNYEPAEALFVPDNRPLVFYEALAGAAMEGLKPGGQIYLEINPRHADAMVRLLERSGYGDVELRRDMHGKNRFITACKTDD